MYLWHIHFICLCYSYIFIIHIHSIFVFTPYSVHHFLPKSFRSTRSAYASPTGNIRVSITFKLLRPADKTKKSQRFSGRTRQSRDAGCQTTKWVGARTEPEPLSVQGHSLVTWISYSATHICFIFFSYSFCFIFVWNIFVSYCPKHILKDCAG